MEARSSEGRRNPYAAASASSSFGAGGKLRSARKASSSKSTPYDRPLASSFQGRGALAAPSSSSSIASRVVHTASRLITSSASYVFSSFFGAGRNSLRIKSGQDEGAMAEKLTRREKEKEEEEERGKEEVEDDEEVEHEVEGVEAMDESPLKEERQATNGTEIQCSQREEPTKLGSNTRKGESTRGKVSWGPNTTITPLDNGSRPPEPGGLYLDGPHQGSDLIRVEEMLKQKMLSRDEVDRLTGLLQSRVTEDSPSEDIVATPRIPERPTPPATNTHDESFVAPMSEAQRWREERKKARLDLTPIEVARAYMGERTTLPKGLTLSIRSIDHHQIDKAPEPQPLYGSGILGDRYHGQIDKTSEVQPHVRLGGKQNHQTDKSFEFQPHGFVDRYRPSPMGRSSLRASSALRVPKQQGPVLEEGWMSVGPVRRTRQRVFQTMHGSLYARGPANSGESVTPRAPPMQSSHTARKILDTLEKLSPSPKGRPLDGEFNLSVERTPLGLDSDRYDGRKIPEFSRFSNLRSGASNGKLDFESMSKTPLMKKTSPPALPPPPIGFNTVKMGSPPEGKGPADYSHPEAPARIFGSNAPPPATAGSDSQDLSVGGSKEESKLAEGKLLFSSQKITPSNNKPASFGLPSATLVTSTTFTISRKEEDSSRNVTTKEEYPLRNLSRREEHSGKENAVRAFAFSENSNIGADIVSSNLKESNTFLSGALPSCPVFSFKPGNNSFPVSTIGDESEVSTTSSFSFFKPQSSATKSIDSNITAVSSLQSSPFSFGKLAASSQQMDIKLAVSSVSTANTSFSFAPTPTLMPMPCVSAPPVSMSSSMEEATSSGPVFSFTSPSSEGMKIPDSIGAPDESFPGPTFTFGGSEQKASSVSVPSQSASLPGAAGFGSGVFSSSSRPASAVFGSTLFSSSSGVGSMVFGKASGANTTGFGSASVAGSTGLSNANGFGSMAGSASATGAGFGSGNGFSPSGSSGLSNGFGSTFGSGSAMGFGSAVFASAARSESAVFGSTSLSGADPSPTAKLSTSPPMAAFDLGGGFSSGATGLEKNGRKFIKVKRRK